METYYLQPLCCNVLHVWPLYIILSLLLCFINLQRNHNQSIQLRMKWTIPSVHSRTPIYVPWFSFLTSMISVSNYLSLVFKQTTPHNKPQMGVSLYHIAKCSTHAKLEINVLSSNLNYRTQQKLKFLLFKILSCLQFNLRNNFLSSD
jgi:hypothetical protein